MTSPSLTIAPQAEAVRDRTEGNPLFVQEVLRDAYELKRALGQKPRDIRAVEGLSQIVPEARIPEMAEKIRRAIVWIYNNAQSLGGDPGRLHVLGHSSGGHLCSVMLTTDWTTYGVPARMFTSGLVGCGMYDLKAPMLSARAQFAKVTQEEEHALSAMRHLDLVHCPIIIGYGDRESPEFQRQGRDFATVLKRRGLHMNSMSDSASIISRSCIRSLSKTASSAS